MLKKFLQLIFPYRFLIFSILLIAFLVSTLCAFQFDSQLNDQNNQKRLNPRTSSIRLKKEKQRPDGKKQPPADSLVQGEKKVIKKIKIDSSSQIKTAPKSDRKVQEYVNLVVSAGSQAGSYQIAIDGPITGIQVMERASQQYGLNYQADYYSGYGAFISSIGNLQADANHYWALYFNGGYCQVGISQLIAKDKDQISWQYTSF